MFNTFEYNFHLYFKEYLDFVFIQVQWGQHQQRPPLKRQLFLPVPKRRGTPHPMSHQVGPAGEHHGQSGGRGSTEGWAWVLTVVFTGRNRQDRGVRWNWPAWIISLGSGVYTSPSYLVPGLRMILGQEDRGSSSESSKAGSWQIWAVVFGSVRTGTACSQESSLLTLTLEEESFQDLQGLRCQIIENKRENTLNTKCRL